MNIDSVKNVGSGFVNTAKSTVKSAYSGVKNSFNNPVARNNFKKSIPSAALTAGIFSLFSLLPNRKADGKQGKLEKKSGTLASLVFAVASFKKFFATDGQSFKDIFSKLKKLNLSEALELLKLNKSNAILYIASIIGIRIATDITTRGIDAFVNEALNTKQLGD